jgi:hypothetical protein
MRGNLMGKRLATIIGISMIAILAIFIPSVAQDNLAGLQGDDVEIYVDGGASITLQGDDFEIYTNRLTTAANPQSIMQGDDTEVFIILGAIDSLQGDDVEIFNSQSAISVSSISPQTEAVAPIIPDLSASLPEANPNVLNQLSETVYSGLPEMRRNEWQANPVNNAFLMIGGGIGGMLLLIALILIFGGMRTDYEQA